MTREKKRPSPTIPTAVTETLAEALPPIAPAPQRAAAIKAQLMDRVRAGRSHYVTVRSGEGDWVQMAPLVQMKLLHQDASSRSFLLRLAPGARLPSHGHAGDEACVVLEGSVMLGDVEAHAGDYHLAISGSVHEEITTRTGALLFLRADIGANLNF